MHVDIALPQGFGGYNHSHGHQSLTPGYNPWRGQFDLSLRLMGDSGFGVVELGNLSHREDQEAGQCTVPACHLGQGSHTAVMD
jgi:hypothetical protein